MSCHTRQQQAPRRFGSVRRVWWCSFLLVLVAACAGTTTPTATSSPNPTAPPAPQITTLTVWHGWSDEQANALNAVARRYEQSNPLVRIRLEAQPAAALLRTFGAHVADASAPQIIITPSRYLGELAQRTYLVPLDDAALPLPDVLPAAVDAARVDAQLYGVPLTADGLVLFYDRRAYSTPPQSFDDFAALPSTAPVTGTAQWGLGYYLSLDRTLPYLQAWGGTLFNEAGEPVFATSSRDATTGWLNWLRDLHANPAVLATPDYSALDEQIQAGRVLSVIDWAHKEGDYARLWQGAAGIAPLPRVAPGQPQTLLRADVAGINTVTTPEQRTAAEAFLRYLLDPGAQTLLGEQSRGTLLPAHNGATVSAPQAAIRAALGEPQAPSQQIIAAWRPLEAMVSGVVANTSADAAIDQANSAVAGGP